MKNQREKDFLDVCELLRQLAAIKNAKLEEQFIASMAMFLLRDLSKSDIAQSISYLSRRRPGFPDASDFFNLIAPVQSLEELAEKEIGALLGMIKDGWDNSKDKLTDIQRDLLDVWNWYDLAKGSEKDLQKIRLSMSFYLKSKLASTAKLKIQLSQDAFANYKENNKRLQGEIGEEKEYNLIN